MFKISSLKYKFSTAIVLLTFIFCFIFISNGFATEISAQNNIFNWPLKGEVITPFGTYVHPVSGETKSHSGIDIKGAPDSEVFAAASGIVYFSGYTPAGGSDGSVKNTITILHSNGYKTTYLQLKDVSLKKDDSVLQGQVIGKLAVAGDLSSPETHLHFGIKDENEKYVDPNKLFPLPPISSETSNPVPVETSDDSSSGTVENPVVVSESVSTQTQSTDSEGNNLEQVQASEASTNAQEINSTQIVPQPNENTTSQETLSAVSDSEAQAVIPSSQEENKVANISEISQTAAGDPVNFVKENNVDSTNENTELKNKMNNEANGVTSNVIPAKAGIQTNENWIPHQVRNDTTLPVQNDTVGQASHLAFQQTPKPKFTNPLPPPFTKGGMGGLLLLLTTLGIFVFSTEFKKLKNYGLVKYAF